MRSYSTIEHIFRPKFCVVVNNFAEKEETIADKFREKCDVSSVSKTVKPEVIYKCVSGGYN